MSYVQNYHHLVIGTKNHEMVLPVEFEMELYSYIAGYFKNNNCQLLAINGIPNHIHILVNMNPMLSPALEFGNLKRMTSLWLKENPRFPIFKGWQKEYASFTVSYSHLTAVRGYIENQKIHHADKGYEEEYQRLILKNGLVYYKPNQKQ